MAILIAVFGTAPGIGKSTLTAALVEWLRGKGSRVDHFREEDVLGRPEFASLADQFSRTGRVDLPILLSAVKSYLATVDAGHYDAVVADALIPFVPSLLAWGYSEDAIDDFLTDLSAVLAPTHTVLVYLDGDPHTALSRAATREGPDWLTWYVDKLARYGVSPAVHDIDSACAYLQREREVSLRLVGRQPWDLIRIDQADQLVESAVRKTAQESLAQILGRGEGAVAP